MTKDSTFTYIHLSSSRLADLFEEFTRPSLPTEEIFIPPSRLPPNPEDEDDVVPDQHAAFGIQRATQARREPAWRDLGLDEVVSGEGIAALNMSTGQRGAERTSAVMTGSGPGQSGVVNSAREQVAVAGLGRGAGVGSGVGGMGLGRGEVRARGGVTGVGARRGAASQGERASSILPR